MSGGADDLAEFLLARLDEAERTAQALGGAVWRRATWVGDEYNDAVVTVVTTGSTKFATPADDVVVRCGVEYLDDGEILAEHIARHDPAGVLDEVASKRRLVELHRPEEKVTGWRGKELICEMVCPTCVWVGDDEDVGGNLRREMEYETAPCGTLQLLALPYAAHPDYREEWQPDPHAATACIWPGSRDTTT